MFFNELTVKRKLWAPPALRAPVLVVTVLICWALIAILQYLLIRSQRDGGIIFAPKINDLPLSRTFLYLYFPTILAVIFSICWAWIDLETKRMEPYYQLSKKNGALGKNSLLLHYPFDFIPWAPWRALRDRHWPVFWASFAVVLVTWGLVPTQAGIFSVRTVTRTTNTTFSVSTSSIPIEQQATTLTFRYAQSTYAIVSLNETLPPYMERNYTLAPFEPSTKFDIRSQGQGVWTAPTTMYSLDLYCEDVSHKSDNSKKISYVSNGGCNFTLGLTGNLTVGTNPRSEGDAVAVKDYTAFFVGYHNGGFADYSLDVACPKSENTTFYAAIEKNKVQAEDPPQDVTAVFCKPTYYQQAVSATVDITTKRPLKVTPIGDKEVLAWNVFNTTMFETLLNAGSLGDEVRADTLPTKSLPVYVDLITKRRTNPQLSLTIDGSVVQPMVGLAIGAGTQPLEDYLDWKVLSKAYADAYRLLFARAMVEVLGNDPGSSKEAIGQQKTTTEAVVLEPVFVYVVVGILSVVSVATIALLVISVLRKRILRSDPSTIASVMAIAADNQPLLADFANLDCCTVDDMQRVIGQKRYMLVDNNDSTTIIEIEDPAGSSPEIQAPILLGQRRDTPVNITKPIRPFEFSLWIAFPFVNLFIILAIALGVIFSKAQANGLPLPSSNGIVQNILENYIPTAIATLIEPMWILINRLLCMLRPLEELQDCNAKANKSIDLNYSSLPPQLVVFKALKSKHFILAAVCGMALLANILAVAFAGLFNQHLIDTRQLEHMNAIYGKFVSINGSIGPVGGQGFGSLVTSGAYRGGNGEDQFLIAESNFTEGTPLPAWTDEKLFYQPFVTTDSNGTNNIVGSDGNHLEGSTRAFGAELDCKRLELGNNFEAAINVDSTGSIPDIRASMNVTVSSKWGDVRCRSGSLRVRPGPIRSKATCVTGPSSLEILTSLGPRANATQNEKDVCMGSVVMGWMRDPQGSCPLGKDMPINEQNSLFVQCRPKWVTGSATIRVDLRGRLIHKSTDANLTTTEAGTGDNDLQELFTNDPINLIGQSNQYLFKADSNGWHNDSFADDFINYFIIRGTNSSRLTDPKQAVPTFEDVAQAVSATYSRLFAIWVGTNKELLFEPAGVPAQKIEVWAIKPEQRLFLSKTMFVISEAILCTYAIVAIFVYMRRPGQYLARLPTSIASLIALFAASSAVQDMRGTSHLDGKGRAQHLKNLDSRYGYGSYIGGEDGRVHIGIDKTPFVRVRSKTTWLEKRMPLLRKTSRESAD